MARKDQTYDDLINELISIMESSKDKQKSHWEANPATNDGNDTTTNKMEGIVK